MSDSRVESLRPLLDASPVPMLVSTRDSGIILAANRLVQDLFPPPSGSTSIIGCTGFEIGLWTSPEARASYLERLDAESHQTQAESVVVRPDGSSWTCLLSSRLQEEDHATAPLIVSTLQDVTGLRAFEKRASKLELEQKALETGTTESIARISPDGKRLYTSPAIWNLLGYTPEELEGSTFPFFYFHPDDTPRLVEETDAILSTGTPQTLVYRCIRKDGSCIWVETTCSVLRDPSSQAILEILTSTRDITARKQAEDLFRSVVSSLAEGVILLDGKGIVLQANERAHEILHAPFGALHGVDMLGEAWSFVDKQGNRLPSADLPGAQTLRDGQPRREVPVGVDTPDGARVWIASNSSIISCHPDGSSAVMLVSFSDITERLRQEDALRRSEEMYRLLAENSLDVVTRHDPRGGYLWASPSMATQFGLDPQSLIGTSALDTVHPDDRDAVLGTLGTILAGPVPTKITYRHRTGNGSWATVESVAKSLRDPRSGEVQELLVSTRDISSRLKSELDLRQSEARLREVADMSQDMLSRHDMAGVCLWASPACRHILGIEPDAVIGRSAFDFIVSEDHPAVQGALVQLVEQGTSRLQYRIRRTDGSFHWCETIWGLTHDPDGTPLEIHCSTRDIGEQKRQSDLLRTSQRIAHLGGWETDLATGTTRWTEELFRIHEILDDEIDTKNIRSMLPYLGDSSRETMLAAHEKLLQDGTPWSLVLHGITTKGNPLVIRSTCEGVFEDGKLRTLRGTTQDITQQERLRQQLESVSKLNASILSTTEALIVLLDREGRIVRFNHACERLTGWIESEVLGQPFFETLIPEAEREAVRHVFRNLTGGMFPNQYENHWLARRGNLLWISWANSVLLDDSGAIQYVLGTGIDMTAHRATQIELLDSQEKWRVLIESAPEAIVILDFEAGRFLQVNPAAERLFGRPKSELLRLGPVEVSPAFQPDGRASDIGASQWIRRALDDGAATFEWVHLDSRGRELLCLVNLSPMPPGHEGHPLLRASIVDITERRKTESVMESLVRGTSSHFGQAFFDVLVKDLAQLLEVQYAYIARIESGEVRTLSFFADGNLAVPMRYPLQDSPCQQVVQSGPLFATSSVRALFPSSRVLEDLEAESYMGVPLLNAAHEPIGVLAVLHSRAMPESELARAILTIFAGRAQGEVERLEAEQALRHLNIELEHRVHDRTAELQASNRELEAFSYSVSHDLRSPLRSVDGFAQALQEDYEAVLDQTGMEYLARIRAASHRMADLIDDLLSLSRSSRTTLHKSPLDLSGMAADILRGLRESDPDRSVDVHIATGLHAFADPVLMRSVLENLLGNAWKYSRRQDHAVIEFRGEDAPEGFLGLAVADNGAGFDMAHANRLFRTFQRLHGTEEFEGNGIGLATVRRILERHGGSISGEGTVGFGATFHFRLPHGPASESDRDPSSPFPRD